MKKSIILKVLFSFLFVLLFSFSGTALNVSAEEITSETTNTVFLSNVQDSEGLTFTTYMGNYAVSGIGTCKDTEIVIPSTYNNKPVTMVYQKAFANNTTITSVTLPEGIVEIMNSAFEGCSNLQSINLPEGLTTIGQYSFAMCSKLQKVTLPSTVTKIYNYSFNYCTSLTEVNISEGATTIGNGMFMGCSSLSKVTIPSTLTSIGGSAFSSCSNLKTVVLNSSTIAEAATSSSSCGSLFLKAENVYINPSIDSIGSYITSSLPYIAKKTVDGVLYNHYSSIPNLYPTEPIQTWDISSTVMDKVTAYLYQDPEDLSGYALVIVGSGQMSHSAPWTSYSSNINEVIIGEGVTSVGQRAFFGFKKLQNIVLPNTVTQIYNSAFENCTSLHSIELSKNLTSIGNYVFYNCTALTEIIIPSKVTTMGTASVESCFSNCSNLKTVIIDSATIAQSATSSLSVLRCAEKVYVKSSISSVGSGISSEFPYKSTKNLNNTTYTLYSKNYSIKNTLFDTDPVAMWDVSATSSDQVFGIIYTNPDNADGYVLVIEGTGSMGWKNTYAPWASYISKINKAYILDGVTNIKGYTFTYSTSALEEVIIGASVKNIEAGAFRNCSLLSEITIPSSVTAIGNDAFSGCTALKKIVIPNSVTSMGTSVFYRCSNLETVVLSNRLTIIPDSTFQSCSNLKNITIPDNVTSIGASAFYGCSNLIDINLGNSKITSIGQYAFRDCKKLLYADLPDSLISLGAQVFDGCTELVYIRIPSGISSLHYTMFYGCNKVCTVVIDSPSIIASLSSLSLRPKTFAFNIQDAPTISDYYADVYTNIEEIVYSGHQYKLYSQCTHAWQEAKVINEHIACEQDGVIRYQCSLCYVMKDVTTPKHTESDWIVVSESSCLNDGYKYTECVTCGSIVQSETVKSEGHVVLKEAISIKNDSSYPFMLDGNIYSSTNKTANSTSVFKIVAIYDYELNIEYFVSSCIDTDQATAPPGDYLIIRHNDTVLVEISGVSIVWKAISLSLKAGDIITIEYAKSTAFDGGDDAAHFKINSDGFIHTPVDNLVVESCKDPIVCSICNEVVKKIDHVYSDWMIDTPVTCESDGSKYKKCINCQTTIRESIEKLGHDYIDHEAKAPTCTEIGWDAYQTCSRCDYTTYVEKEALDHDRVQHSAKDKTCTEVGWYAYETCQRDGCDYTTYREIPASHNEVVDKAVAPTCTTTGLTAGKHCADCPVIIVAQEVVPELGHDYVDHEAKAPTCTEIGWDAYQTCSRCDYTTYVEKEALGHQTGEFTPANPATCTEDGNVGYYFCSVCEKYLDEDEKIIGDKAEDVIIKAKGHTESDWLIDKAATCTEAGEKHKECTVCHIPLGEKETISALGHDEVKHEAKAPTCTEIGWDAYVTCDRDGCDYTTYVETEALKHNFDYSKVAYTWNNDYTACLATVVCSHDSSHIQNEEGLVTSSTTATCEKSGEITYKAEFSNAEFLIQTFSMEQAALGHDEVQHDAKAPTCTEIGWNDYVACVREGCSGTTYVEIPAKGHTYGEWKVQKEATCTTDGEQFRVCAHCYEEQYIQFSTINKLGHDWKKVKELSNNVKVHYTCSRCSEDMETPLDADANQWIQYIRCNSDYVFYIVSDRSVDYINENLTIINVNLERAYGESYTQKYIDYELTNIGNNVYEVKVTNGYVEGATYRVSIYGDIEFRDYWQPVLMLLVKSPIYTPIFDFDPYIPDFDFSKGWFEFNFPDFDFPDLKIGDWIHYKGGYGIIIDIGDGIIKYNPISDIDERIKDLLDRIKANGGFRSKDGYITFDDIQDSWNAESITEAFKEQFANNDSFLAFKKIVGDAAEEYLINKGIEAGTFKNENITFKPIFEKSEKDPNAIIVGISFDLKYVIKKAGEKQGEEINLGTIVVHLVVKNEMKIEYDTGITPFEGALLTAYVDLMQTSTASVELSAKYNFEYDLNDAEYQFIANHARAIIHRYYCQYIEQTKNTSGFEAMNKEEMLQYVAKGYHLCELCQPADESFMESTTFMYKEITKDGAKVAIVHREGCFHIADSENYKKISSLATLEGAEYCDWCMMTKSEKDFEAHIKNSLKYADWGSIMEEIQSELETSGAKDLIGAVANGVGAKKTEDVVGINIAKKQIYLDGMFAVTAEVYFVFHFDLEASFKFELSQDYTHCARLEYNILPNLLEKSPVHIDQWFEDEGRTVSIELVGKVHANAGVKVVLEAGILLDPSELDKGIIKPLIGLKLDAEGGVYIQLTGILSYYNKTNAEGDVVESFDYGAARFETGLYVKVDGAVKMWEWEFKIFAFEKEYPLAVMGFDKAYYAYVNDELHQEVHSDKLLNDKISVKYFDLDDMTTVIDEEFSIGGVDGLYSVIYELKLGQYCKIVDGKLIIDPNAPHVFEDVLYITIVGEASGWIPHSGSEDDENASFHLRTYEIYITLYNHNYSEIGVVATPPTCQTQGVMEYYCETCGHIRAESIEVVDHKFSPKTTVQEPTCTEGGYAIGVCIYEGCYEERIVSFGEPLKHLEDVRIVKQATCLDNGYTEIKCSRCRLSVKVVDEVEALGHNFADSEHWIVLNEGSCSEPAQYKRPCLNDGCDEYVIEYNEEDGHDLVSTPETIAKAPTCTEIGWDAYKICNRDGCNYTTYVELPALGHDEVQHEAKAPTCTEIGWNAYETCKRDGCGYTTYEEIPALGHDEVEHEAKTPTCTEHGWNEYVTCDRDGCDYTTYVELPALGHDEVEHEAKAPTCTEIGWNEYVTCDRDGCGYTTYEEIPALGHDEVQHDAKAPTCTEHGWNEYVTCGRDGCDYTTYVELPVKGHNYGEWIVEVPVTCEDEGTLGHYHCSACNKNFDAEKNELTTIVIPVLGHTESEWIVDETATCTEDGSKHKECTVCEKVLATETIEKLGHDKVQHPAQAETCAEHGWNAYETCTRCDYTTYEKIPAKGHTYGEWTQTVAPGCETKGEERRDCVDCDHFEIAEISALGHSDDDKNNICDICKMDLSNVSGGDSGNNEEPSKDDAQSIDSSTVIIAVCSIGGVGIIGGLWFFIKKRRYW